MRPGRCLCWLGLCPWSVNSIHQPVALTWRCLHSMLRYIEGYVQKVSPGKTPEVRPSPLLPLLAHCMLASPAALPLPSGLCHSLL